MDLVFYTTILVIFATAIVGPFVRSRLRDRCLRSLDDSPVVLERVDQDPVWGRLRVYATGLELLYDAPSPGTSGIDKYSYILYKEAFGSIHALWRYPDKMTEDERRRRAKRIRRTARPPFYLRSWRWCRNVMGTLRDAFLQTANALLGRVAAGASSTVLKSQEAQLKTMSSELIGYAGNAYEPILERYLSRRVVIEVTQGERKDEYVGLLRNYTADFIELADVQRPMPLEWNAAEPREPLPGLTVTHAGDALHVENRSGNTVRLAALVGVEAAGDSAAAVSDDGGTAAEPVETRTDVGITVADGAGATVDLAGRDPSVTRLEMTYPKPADLVVPRGHAMVRHAGEAVKD